MILGRSRTLAVWILLATLALPAIVHAVAWNVIVDGIGVLTGVVEIGSWIVAGASSNQTASVEWPLDPAFHTELGLTVVVPFKVKFNFEDTIWGGDYVFLEIYATLNNDLLAFKRYPEIGYFNKADNWFDDSTSETLNQTVYLGAKNWPCQIPTDKLKISVFLWRDPGGRLNGSNWSGNFIDTGERYIGMWVEGKGLSPRVRYNNLLTKLAESSVESNIFVENPFYVNQLVSDNGASKDHHNGLFQHEFDVWMQYAFNYPNVQVRDPAPPTVAVTVNGLAAQGDWFWGTDDALQFTFQAGRGRTDSRNFLYLGRHGLPGDHHPNQQFLYADDWGAHVTGQNVVYHTTTAGVLTSVPYTFSTNFRPGPAIQACTPIPFGVSDFDPHNDIPTLGTWGLAALALGLWLCTIAFIRRRTERGGASL